MDGGAGKKRDAKKSKMAARRLPDCARRAQGFLKTIKVLKHKVSTATDDGKGSILGLRYVGLVDNECLPAKLT